MNTINANFIFNSAKKGDYPNEQLPEFAFTGRSNVGKSSFINSILLRKNLAKISSNPGKTKSINFYKIEDKYILADMPGFGYAKVSKTSREYWEQMIYYYFTNRKQLRFITVLVDSRHPPMALDLSLIEWLENNQRTYLIVLTKCDKISQKQIDERIDEWKFITQNCNFAMDILPTSSETGMGREAYLAIIKKHLKGYEFRK
jgi:GTP-binding protein